MMTAVIALACPTALWEFAWLEVGLALSLSVTRAQGDPGTMTGTGTGTAPHITAQHCTGPHTDGLCLSQTGSTLSLNRGFSLIITCALQKHVCL